MSSIKKINNRLEITPKPEKLGGVVNAEYKDESVPLGQFIGLTGYNKSKRVYRAIISQSGTNAPTEVAVLENTLNCAYTWNYDNVGVYNLHCVIMTQYNVFYSIVTGQGGTSGIIMAETGQDLITNNWEARITTLDLTGNAANDVLSLASLEITIYT